MKITYAVATSLDGFIARVDGDVSWLDDVKIPAEETGLEQFFASIDGLVMGRNTYDFVYNYGSWPYESKLTWVCSHREVPKLDGANLIVASNPAEVIAQASARSLKHLWLVGGGQLASSFLENGWITHISISEMPVRLGSGIPLFAKHNLSEISWTSESIVQKTGFRKLEFTLVNRLLN